MPQPNIRVPYDVSKDSLHHLVQRAILARYYLSKQYMENRQTTYEKLENQFLAYLPETDHDAMTRTKYKEQGKPKYTTLQIPYTYAEVMTMHTYFSTVMLGRNPIFQYMGRHGESQRQKLAVDAIMAYQTRIGQNIVPLYVWILDALKYGRGILGTFWDEKYSYFTRIVDRPVTVGPIRVKTVRETVQERVLQYVGNRFFTVRPQDFFPDPRVPTGYIQDGEFVGYTAEVSWNSLVRGELEGRYFNIRHVRKFVRSKSTTRDLSSSPKLDLPADESLLTDPKDTGFVNILEMAVEVIPREWRLADTNRPQKWLFTLAGNEVVIQARPLGAYHDKFEFFSMEPEFDGYSLHSRSPGEVIKPLEDTITWLFNSHFYNVRRALNDLFVVDPSRIEMTDVLNPLPGGAIRAKPLAYGEDVSTAIRQLPVADITRAHIGDTRYVLDILQRIDGVNDSVLGLIQQSGRKTATEVRQGGTFSVSRLKAKAEFMGAMGFDPLAVVSLQNTQQYYSQEQKFRIAGNLADPGAEPFVEVTPAAIAGSFDFVPMSGDMPLDRFALANLWRQIFVDAARIPGMEQQLDFMAIFAHFAKLSGATDIDQFRVQVVSDEMLAQQAQAGNVIPLGGQYGGPASAGPADEGDERAASRVPVPGQTPGLGPSG